MENIRKHTSPVLDLTLPAGLDLGGLDLGRIELGRLELAAAGRTRLFDERAHTFRALTAAWRHALRIPGAQLRQHRYVIFSDTHRGDRRAHSDEFLPNEAAYCHALQHYLDDDYRLVLNGDIEEGWKADYATIIDAYRDTAYALESEFAGRGEGYYLRIWGNHDNDWADPRLVHRHLEPLLGHRARVHPAIVLGDRVMVAHGHQGEWHSDRYTWLSRRVVRHIWTPIQRLFGLTNNRSAALSERRLQRDNLLHSWARDHGLLLIAGHTHRPMFHPGLPEAAEADTEADSEALHYVNNGCCVHRDGITGLEIDRGEMRLVRWGRAAGSRNKGSRAITRTVLSGMDLDADKRG